MLLSPKTKHVEKLRDHNQTSPHPDCQKYRGTNRAGKQSDRRIFIARNVKTRFHVAGGVRVFETDDGRRAA